MSDFIYVRDDMGNAWYFDDGAIRMVLAEKEVGHEENGYPCASLEEGIALLKKYGDITGDDAPGGPT